MFATKSYYTAGHIEIYAQGNNVRPQISSEAVVHELRTYQLKTKYEVHESLMEKWDSSVYLRFAFIPCINDVRFPAHAVNMFGIYISRKV
jgi:hypothetical protein